MNEEKPRPFPLVTCEWLANQIDVNKQLVILDVTWFSKQNARDKYEKEHIPTAVHFEIFKGAELSELYPRKLPSGDIFQENARAAGVNTDYEIVLYSDSDKMGYLTSGRAWWMFKYFGHEKVFILDGGWQQWKKGGYSVTSEIPQVKRGDFIVNIKSQYRRKFEDMQNICENEAEQIIDCRSEEHYKSGHIPGAKNIPALTLLDETAGRLKNEEELRKIFESAGIDVKQPCVTYCNSGMSSCTMAMVAYLCGSYHWAVYVDGFTEWKARCSPCQIETGLG